TFTSAYELGEVVAGRVFQHIGACPDDFTRRKHHLKVEYIVTGHTVFNRLWTTRIIGQISAQETGSPAGGIRGIKKSLFFHRILKHFGNYAGLDGGLQI